MGPPIAPLRARWRILVTLVVVGYFAHWTYSYRLRPGVKGSDFSQVWYAAGAVLQRQDPYSLIGPGLPYDWPAHFYYPLTAAIAALPLALLPLLWAQVVFTAVSAGALTWTLTRFGVLGVLMLVSPSAVMGVQYGQWSPLFTVALFVPVVGALFAAKPTVGAAIFAARPSWWALGGGLALAAVAFLAQPTWPLDWWHALRSTDVVGDGSVPYGAPLLHPGGFLLAAALLRWRRPEARLLLVLAVAPQTPLLYETLPLLLIACTAAQVAWFFAAGWLSLIAENVIAWRFGTPPRLVTNAASFLLLFYLPALWMVLRRPNEGPAPAWVERLVRRAPRWLRGQPRGQPQAASH